MVTLRHEAGRAAPSVVLTPPPGTAVFFTGEVNCVKFNRLWDCGDCLRVVVGAVLAVSISLTCR